MNKIGLTPFLGALLFYPTASSDIAVNVPFLMIMINGYILHELNMIYSII